MVKNILVPLDGAKRSEQALAVAAAIAKFDAAHVTLLHIVEDSAVVFANPAGLPVREGVGDKLLQGEFARANEYLAGAAEQMRAAGVAEVEALALRGVGYRVISEVAAGGYDLIVMTAYGRTQAGATPLGSVASQVLLNTNLPVLLVSSHQGELDSDGGLTMRRIMVPLDGSAQAEQALPIAVSLAEEADATLVLLGVTPPGARRDHEMVQQAMGSSSVMLEIVPLGGEGQGSDSAARRPANDYRYLSAAAQGYIPKGINYAVVEASNEPDASILGNAQRLRCDMLLLTAHGSTGNTNALSRLSEEIVSQSAVPVLILRPAAATGTC